MRDDQPIEKVEVLRCNECGLPAARIVNGGILIESRHHGRIHKSFFSLEWLRRKIAEADQSKAEAASAK